MVLKVDNKTSKRKRYHSNIQYREKGSLTTNNNKMLTASMNSLISRASYTVVSFIEKGYLSILWSVYSRSGSNNGNCSCAVFTLFIVLKFWIFFKDTFDFKLFGYVLHHDVTVLKACIKILCVPSVFSYMKYEWWLIKWHWYYGICYDWKFHIANKYVLTY